MLLPLTFLGLQAQAQTSVACTNASLNGTYHYLFSGTVKSGNATASYEELGKLSLDGKGGLTGSSTTSTAGVIAQTSFSGSYLLRDRLLDRGFHNHYVQFSDRQWRELDAGWGYYCRERGRWPILSGSQCHRANLR